MSSAASLGIAHSPFPSWLKFLPETVAGSISKVRHNEALAAITF
jgi:hypothetical protein